MKWVLLTVIGLLLLGPLRRRLVLPLLCGHWRIILPLAVGAVFGHVAVTRLMSGVPNWMRIVGPIMGAFMIGGAMKEFIDDLAPPKR